MMQNNYLPEDLETVSDEMVKIKHALMEILNNATAADFNYVRIHQMQIEHSLKLLMHLNEKKEIRSETTRRNFF